MDWHARVRSELPVVTGDRHRDREIQDEIAAHLADREQELCAAGRSQADIEAIVSRELLMTARKRRRLGGGRIRVFADSAQDLRYAARLLARRPGHTLAAVATLALAIGTTTALFSIVRAVLLQPLPYPDPERLTMVWESSPAGDVRNPVAGGNYLDWRERAASFDALGAVTRMVNAALTGGGEPIKVESAGITPSVLNVLGAVPAHGRAFTQEDGQTNAPAVALLSHGFWQRRFGGQLSAIGQTLVLDDQPVTVVGVMPHGFDFPHPDVDLLTNLWFADGVRTDRRSHNYVVVGRLKPGVSAAAADAELDAIAQQLAVTFPQFLRGWSVNVVGLHADAVRDVKPMLVVLSGVVLAVLLIACANLANLQLARAAQRMREMAVRAAIGAGAFRMFRQMLTESLLLGALGGAAGVALAAAALPVLVAAAPADVPFIARAALDRVVLAAAAATTLFSALIVGVVPAVRVARSDLRPLLQTSRVRGDRQQRRLRQGLVVAQLAVALVLVVSSTLLVRSFLRLHAVAPGYDPRGVLTVEVDLPRARYSTPDAQRAFYDRLFERLRANPAITGAAGTTAVPGEGASMTFSFAIEGRRATNPSGREDPVPLQGVTPGYFEVMRIPLLRGRGFASSDGPESPPVVIINESLAKRHWPAGDAIGARVNFRPGQMPWRQIVGIVADTRDEGRAEPSPPTIYVPFAQRASTWTWMSWQTLVVRGRTSDASALVADVRAALWSIDANLPLLEIATVEERLATGEGRRRVATMLLLGFAVLALVLSSVGVYGVMSYTVAEQRQEIGIRIALGAAPSAVARRVVVRALLLAGVGAAVGIGGALLATRSLAALLFETGATDPAAFSITVALLLSVAAAAAWLPARRAMHVDPIEVLRD